MKRENAITILSLVITIIVLMILAGVAINTVTGGDSVILNASKIRETSRVVEVKDIIESWKLQSVMDKYFNLEHKDIEVLLLEMLDEGLITQDEYNNAIKTGYIEINNERIFYFGEANVAEVNSEDELALALQNEEVNVILVMQPITITKEIVVDRSVRIWGSGSSAMLNRGTDYKGRFIRVKADCNLILNNLILDGGAENWSFDQEEADANAAINIAAATETAFVLNEEDIKASAEFILNQGNLAINNCVLQNNLNYDDSDSRAGIVTTGTAAKNVTLKIVDSTIKHCASYMGSGAIISSNYSDIELENTNIIDNYGYGNGGIFYLYDDTTLTMNGGKLSNNIIYGNGTSITSSGSKFVLNSGEISYNRGYRTSTDGHGCTIYVYANSFFVMNGGKIENNFTNTGCIRAYGDDSEVHLNEGYMANNTSFNDGKQQNIVSSKCAVFDIEEGMTVVGDVTFASLIVNRGTINGNVYSKSGNTGSLFKNEGTINGGIYADKSSIIEDTGTIRDGIIYTD